MRTEEAKRNYLLHWRLSVVRQRVNDRSQGHEKRSGEAVDVHLGLEAGRIKIMAL
jgi:hypothetical protein